MNLIEMFITRNKLVFTIWWVSIFGFRSWEIDNICTNTSKRMW